MIPTTTTLYCLGLVTALMVGALSQEIDDSAELMSMLEPPPAEDTPQQDTQQSPATASVTAIKTNLVDEDHKELEQVYMMVMMVKAFLGSLLMFITPIIRIKSFGLAVINTIINIAKFLHEINFFKPLLAVLAPPPSGPAAPSGPSIPDDRWASPDPSTPPNTSYGAPYRRIGTDSYYHHHQHSSYLNEPQTDWSQNSVYQ